MRYLALLLLVTGAGALAGQDPPSPPKIKRQPNLISAQEIDLVRAETSDAYDIVKRLRPQYLRGRGASSFGNAAGGRTTAAPKVILDGSPIGEIDALRQIPAMNVREIRYLSSSDATTQFGTGYDGGAVVVLTR
jgi:hypothetical protein